MRFAKSAYGKRLHLVEEIDPDFNAGKAISDKALCGIKKHWTRTFNIPMGIACKNCIYIYFKHKKKKWKVWDED